MKKRTLYISVTGAIADGLMVSHARSAGLDAKKYLTNNDAFTFFTNLQDSHYLVNTGLTGTNVMDIQVLLIHPSL